MLLFVGGSQSFASAGHSSGPAAVSGKSVQQMGIHIDITAISKVSASLPAEQKGQPLFFGDVTDDEDYEPFELPALHAFGGEFLARSYPSFDWILSHPSNSYKKSEPVLYQAPDQCALLCVFRI
jgi:hypothetical protein